MPIDKIKGIEKFPEYFQYPINKRNGKWFMILLETQAEAKNWARKYRCFLRSIKARPIHPLNIAMINKEVRTRIEQQPDGDWFCYVVVKYKIQLRTDQGEII